ncbi:MAG TPA: class I SAM-dependent methyltransferase [Blastocatellia bacterium]|nr:class I SAM-dependent methyltransferase [Blastocatellia bacterium]
MEHNSVEAARAAISAALVEAAEIDLSWLEPCPSLTGWELAPDALRLLASLVSRLRPQHILEFGSGLSTRVMARACVYLGGTRWITSVDHDPVFAHAAAEQFKGQETCCRISFQLAPLIARDCTGRSLPMYYIQADQIASSLPADLIVIDGPPAALGGREGVLYQALDFARPGTVLVLDDAAREMELLALSRWQDNLGEAVEVNLLPGFAKGMAAAVVKEAVRRVDLEAHRMRLAIREIRGLISHGEKIILVDQNQWRADDEFVCQSIPFVERDGQYWGPPLDDTDAIREFERMRQLAARFIVFGWPAFWWLDHYSKFARYLRERFQCVLENDRLIAFDVRSYREEGRA